MVSENFSEQDIDILLRLQDAYREIDWLKAENNRLRMLLAEPDDMCNSLPHSKEETEE
jgi:hypothetical protein